MSDSRSGGTGKRLRLSLILTVLGASTLALLAWTQVWGTVDVAVSAGGPEPIAVDGSVAAPAITALALAGFALAGALTIAGPLIRVVLGVLEMLLGASVFLSALLAVADPAHASSAAVTAATGIAGRDGVARAVEASATTGWPYLALVAAVIMAGAGFLIVFTTKRWPGATKRHQTVRFEPVTTDAAAGAREPGRAPDAVVDWDELSRGEDPTSESR
ncbi:hypothetical protein E3T55_18675 [Cryobacterium frigoriphilum]|uniref:Peptidase n=1 Tax=Cryobacterium frigoriphilum TaxID=1259150 RepID=A0A4R8ZU93_9MICO|nr:Trp biosynthesis-associated membrane protein [Cryobacterium frigoriphilum]TFD45677.1 hypothetical protein E3T55_18675 [Cryobacterium frigoriphilum]